MATPPAGSNSIHLSIVVLANQADDPLAATLESVASTGAEIIVMDCAESQKIADICRAHGAERMTPGVELNQGAAWNEALAAAAGSWILCLEAGETLQPTGAHKLSEFVRSEADPKSVYVLMIEIPPSAGQSCGEQSAQVRLIPGQKSLKFAGRVRPSLLLSAAQAGLDALHHGTRIQRTEREYNQAVRTARAERDLQLAQKQLEAEGESAELYVAWGEALSAIGKNDAAVEQFKKAIPLAARGSTAMLEAYYGLLSSLDSNPTAREEQLAACLEALDIYPLDAQLLCGMGSYMLAQNRLDLAARAYTLAVGHGQVDPQTWHLSEIGEVSSSCLSLTQQLMGEEDAARASLEEALIRFPNSIRLRRQLLNVLINQGAAEAAMAEFNRLPATMPMREALRCAVRGALLGSQKNWMAALPYLKTAYTAGCRDVICLRWLSVVLLSTGDVAGALPILQEWKMVEPQNAELQAYLAAAEQVPALAPEAPISTKPEAEPTTQAPTETTEAGTKIRIDTSKQGESAGRAHTERTLPKMDNVLFDGEMPDSPAGV